MYTLQIFSELPFHTFFVAVYAVPVYFIAGLTLDVHDFLTVFAILFLLVYCSRTLAMFSAAVMPTFQLGCFFAQTFFSMYIMSAGFFINLDNIFDGKCSFSHYLSHPLKRLSFYRQYLKPQLRVYVECAVHRDIQMLLIVINRVTIVQFHFSIIIYWDFEVGLEYIYLGRLKFSSLSDSSILAHFTTSYYRLRRRNNAIIMEQWPLTLYRPKYSF